MVWVSINKEAEKRVDFGQPSEKVQRKGNRTILLLEVPFSVIAGLSPRKEQKMKIDNSAFTMQYQAVQIDMEQSRRSENGVESTSLSLNVRVMEFTLKSENFFEDNLNAQGALYSLIDSNEEMKNFLTGIEEEGMLSLRDLGYEGKPILELSPDEASVLIGEGGFFSIEKTAKRGAEFVINGAGDDLEMLRAGREGTVQGFEEAEKLWGGKLPDIAYETQKHTLEMIDERIQALGANALDTAA